ncbi:uracil-DNA glycosylase [candidate division TA06 bacterium]|nr:uracil-DNA glycosylase [candidate division TA06 bacterium]
MSSSNCRTIALSVPAISISAPKTSNIPPFKSDRLSFTDLNQRVISCRRCTRLVQYLSEIKAENPNYWSRPVPGFGDPKAKILILGLAPGRKGSNRTGRMFTGDASGDFLYHTLHTLGLANRPKAWSLEDGLRLKGTYITAAIRCAPPQNRPLREEIENCSPFLREELRLLKNIEIVIALGHIAHETYLRLRGVPLSRMPFQHGAIHRFPKPPHIMLDSYHPSRQNTQTGRLTRQMFLKVFRKAVKLVNFSN